MSILCPDLTAAQPSSPEIPHAPSFTESELLQKALALRNLDVDETTAALMGLYAEIDIYMGDKPYKTRLLSDNGSTFVDLISGEMLDKEQYTNLQLLTGHIRMSKENTSLIQESGAMKSLLDELKAKNDIVYEFAQHISGRLAHIGFNANIDEAFRSVVNRDFVNDISSVLSDGWCLHPGVGVEFKKDIDSNEERLQLRLEKRRSSASNCAEISAEPCRLTYLKKGGFVDVVLEELSERGEWVRNTDPFDLDTALCAVSSPNYEHNQICAYRERKGDKHEIRYTGSNEGTKIVDESRLIAEIDRQLVSMGKPYLTRDELEDAYAIISETERAEERIDEAVSAIISNTKYLHGQNGASLQSKADICRSRLKTRLAANYRTQKMEVDQDSPGLVLAEVEQSKIVLDEEGYVTSIDQGKDDDPIRPFEIVINGNPFRNESTTKYRLNFIEDTRTNNDGKFLQIVAIEEDELGNETEHVVMPSERDVILYNLLIELGIVEPSRLAVYQNYQRLKTPSNTYAYFPEGLCMADITARNAGGVPTHALITSIDAVSGIIFSTAGALENVRSWVQDDPKEKAILGYLTGELGYSDEFVPLLGVPSLVRPTFAELDKGATNYVGKTLIEEAIVEWGAKHKSIIGQNLVPEAASYIWLADTNEIERAKGLAKDPKVQAYIDTVKIGDDRQVQVNFFAQDLTGARSRVALSVNADGTHSLTASSHDNLQTRDPQLLRIYNEVGHVLLSELAEFQYSGGRRSANQQAAWLNANVYRLILDEARPCEHEVSPVFKVEDGEVHIVGFSAKLGDKIIEFDNGNRGVTVLETQNASTAGQAITKPEAVTRLPNVEELQLFRHIESRPFGLSDAKPADLIAHPVPVLIEGDIFDLANDPEEWALTGIMLALFRDKKASEIVEEYKTNALKGVLAAKLRELLKYKAATAPTDHAEFNGNGTVIAGMAGEQNVILVGPTLPDEVQPLNQQTAIIRPPALAAAYLVGKDGIRFIGNYSGHNGSAPNTFQYTPVGRRESLIPDILALKGEKELRFSSELLGELLDDQCRDWIGKIKAAFAARGIELSKEDELLIAAHMVRQQCEATVVFTENGISIDDEDVMISSLQGGIDHIVNAANAMFENYDGTKMKREVDVIECSLAA